MRIDKNNAIQVAITLITALLIGGCADSRPLYSVVDFNKTLTAMDGLQRETVIQKFGVPVARTEKNGREVLTFMELVEDPVTKKKSPGTAISFVNGRLDATSGASHMFE